MADRTTHHSPFHLAELRDSLCPPSKKIARTLGAQAGKSYISRNKNTFYHEASAFTPPHFILRPDCQSRGRAFPSSSTSIICAANTSNAFPTCNGGVYFQGNVQGVCDGFLAEFDLSSHQLLWSTYFGGIHEDYVYDIVSTESGLYISGATLTWQAPTNPSQFGNTI
jgi:hypothetical protein